MPATIPRNLTDRFEPTAQPIRNQEGLGSIRVDYGPRDLLGRFFLMADFALKQLGVTLSFGTFDELVDTNLRNRDSWFPLLPTFHPNNGLCDPSSTYVFIGRNAQGDVVTAQAAKVFDWANTNFKEEAESMRLFYRDPRQAGATERCNVASPSAPLLTGTVAFLGGAWWHPSVRGRLLGSLLSRVSRAYACTHWRTDITMALMSATLINKGFAARNGYQHVELGVAFRKFQLGDFDGAMVWITTEELFNELSIFTAELDLQLRDVEHLRRA